MAILPLRQPQIRKIVAILFSTSERRSEIARAHKAKRIRKLASKTYTDDLRSPPEEIIRRHSFEIISHFYPGAVISHRSALEGQVSPAGRMHITVTYATTPLRVLPGLEIRVWRGPAAEPTDIEAGFDQAQKLFISSQPRALLENLQIARAHGGDEPKTLSDEELEQWVDRHIRVHGVGWMDQLLDQAREVGTRFGWSRELAQLEELFAALRGRKSAYRLRTDLARSRAAGQPLDPDRITLFRNLHARLAVERFPELPRPPAAELENRAFWESYFSNFIEGTRFTVEEARTIVYDATAARTLLKKRPEDAHDVLETFRLITDPRISSEVPVTPTALFEVLKRRHARMMASRPSIEPGVFKTRRNEFGSRIFVAPELLHETLARGWQGARSLSSPTARALYVLFLIAEVHPFIDGNGRISRLAMNAELEAAGLARWIIPTSFRTDYLTVLEALTTHYNSEPFVAFGHKLIDMNSRMPFATFEVSHAYFRSTGALEESSSAFNLGPLGA